MCFLKIFWYNSGMFFQHNFHLPCHLWPGNFSPKIAVIFISLVYNLFREKVIWHDENCALADQSCSSWWRRLCLYIFCQQSSQTSCIFQVFSMFTIDLLVSVLNVILCSWKIFIKLRCSSVCGMDVLSSLRDNLVMLVFLLGVPLFAFTSNNMCFLGCCLYYGPALLPETLLHFLTFVVSCLCLLCSCWALYLICEAVYFRAIISHRTLQLWFVSKDYVFVWEGLSLCM